MGKGYWETNHELSHKIGEFCEKLDERLARDFFIWVMEFENGNGNDFVLEFHYDVDTVGADDMAFIFDKEGSVKFYASDFYVAFNYKIDFEAIGEYFKKVVEEYTK